MSGPLAGLRVLDLSRVLAGPACTQILGDLGADIIKVERPGVGDDTRKWGPPFLKDAHGNDTKESAYYLSCNRNKRSIAIDMHSPEGQDLIHRMLEKSDILIENFKAGDLKKYGLDYDSVHARHPHVIYASITGFGQTGPLSSEPGYDLLVQAMGGLMAITGEPDGAPMKVGVALSDVMTGLYAAIGILAALHARQATSKGQHVDVALLDCTLASLTNLAQYYLTAGEPAPRYGNAHSTIVPYQAFEASDGWIVVAVGNDKQFQHFVQGIGHGEWAADPRFATNSARVKHRDTLVPMIAEAIKSRKTAAWVDLMREIDVPCGPVNRMDQVFALDQIAAREMKITMEHFSGSAIDLVGSPLKLSGTQAEYRLPPPVEGQDTMEILKDVLGLDENDIKKLTASGIVK
ncbi:MAG: CoA transferase [Micavibrio aeruginosavorus]|nr:CoA transferase [Micavibrio aeruginosavorus]